MAPAVQQVTVQSHGQALHKLLVAATLPGASPGDLVRLPLYLGSYSQFSVFAS